MDNMLIRNTKKKKKQYGHVETWNAKNALQTIAAEKMIYWLTY